MTDLSIQKRLASEILQVGRDKVIFDNLRIEDISQAITRNDIKELIKDKAIRKRIFKKQKSNRKDNRKGTGSVKLRVQNRKEKYMAKIRKLRRYLLEIRENKTISRDEYLYLRKLAKSGQFKTRKHLKEYLVTVMKKTIENEKANKNTIQTKKAK